MPGTGPPREQLEPPNRGAQIIEVVGGRRAPYNRLVIPGTSAERPALLRAFWCFFLLFTSWYTIRPIREAMGIARSADDLPWLMLGTVVLSLLCSPLIGRLVTRYSRVVMARVVYRFLAINIGLFYVALVVAPNWFPYTESVRAAIGHGLYVWVSAFSVLIGSLLWSLLAEVFSPNRSKELFGFVAAGCSLGGIVGSAVTLFAVGELESRGLNVLHLLLFAALLLELAARSVGGIVQRAPDAVRKTMSTEPLGGSAWEGFGLTLRSPYLLGISGYILLYTTTGTFAYLIQGSIVEQYRAEMGGRIQAFAWIDLATNSATILLQVFAVRRLVKFAGVAVALAILPLLSAAGFVWLWAVPTYLTIVLFQVVRRSANYGLARPSREMLFTVLSPEEKYKAKNLIDVGLYRAGDAGASMFAKALGAAGFGLAGLAAIAVPISLVWVALTPLLGRGFQAREQR